MDIMFLEYIETKAFGKIAHFVDKTGKDIYSKILSDNENVYYQELSSDELKLIEEDLI